MAKLVFGGGQCLEEELFLGTEPTVGEGTDAEGREEEPVQSRGRRQCRGQEVVPKRMRQCRVR
jgi:hypothetical protein